MKRDGDIASLFRNHAAKKKEKIIVSSSSPDATQVPTQEQEEERVVEEIVNPMTSPPPPPPPRPPSAPPVYDVTRLPHDPGERQPIATYHANDHDPIRRAYILREDDSFKGIKNLVDLSAKLVETKRHKVFDMVYLLLKLVLLLPVATASVERAFSAMTFIKTKLRNKMCDSLLDDCLVTYIEKDIFLQVDEEDIIQTFMDLRKRRPDK